MNQAEAHGAPRLLQVDSERPESEPIAAAAAVLRAGGLVAFPTETVYGLGANALDPAAVQRIFAAKGRPADDPIIVHVRHWPPKWPLVEQSNDETLHLATLLTAAFWPGPLTLVLSRSPLVPDAVTAGLDSVALRAPSHPVARALLAAADLPIAAPSANPFGRTSPTRAEHVRDELGARVDLILDGGPCPVGVESTIVDIRTSPPRLLRPGGISLESLRSVAPTITAPFAPPATPDTPGPRTSPGTRLRHYAPRARLLLLTPSGINEPPSDPAPGTVSLSSALATATHALSSLDLHVGLLAPDEDLPSPTTLPPSTVLAPLGPRTSPATAARRLYTALRTLDTAGVDIILAADPGPIGLSRAIRDRLLRAAEGRLLPAHDLPAILEAAR